MSHRFLGVALFCASLWAFPASADVIVFADDFEGEGAGDSVVNYTGFANWSVSGGSVDLVQQGDWSLNCAGGAGFCVDLDGSTFDAGVLTSVAIALGTGTYVFEFDYSGSQRNFPADTLSVALGLNDFGPLVVESGNGWTTFSSGAFSVDTAGLYAIVFANAGGDNNGILLDNVRLTQLDYKREDSQIEAITAPVPEPATWGLMIAGFAALGFATHRRRAYA